MQPIYLRRHPSRKPRCRSFLLDPGCSISAAPTVLGAAPRSNVAALDEGPSLDDHVVAGDDLRPGDLVYFERVAPRTFLARVLRQGADAPSGSSLFRVARGERTLHSVTLRFAPVAGPIDRRELRKGDLK